MDNQFITHVLRNPQDYTDAELRVVRNAAAERIEKLAAEIDAMQHDLERYMQIANSLATEIDKKDA